MTIDENTITVVVCGRSGSGKSAVVQKIAAMLMAEGIQNLSIDWGLDGCPRRSVEQCNLALDSINRRGGSVMVKEVQLARDGKRPLELPNKAN